MEMNEGTHTMDMLKNFHITASGSDDDDNDGDANDCGNPVEDDVSEDYDEDGEESRDVPVTLGFVEKPRNSWSLLRQVFPSKAGGLPAWLDPVNLPSNRSQLCDICGEPLFFVLQVYAPTSDRESTFHRTLYLFMCPSMTCLLRDQHEQWKRRPEEARRSVKVFRCQLSHSNPFYSSEPPRHDGTDKPLGDGSILCNWCGTWKGDKACADCRRVRYCSEKHQALHWGSGHRSACQKMRVSSGSADDSISQGLTPTSGLQKAASNDLWPEFEIINEDESEYDVDLTDKEGDLNPGLDGIEGATDRTWLSFQERITKAPEQVLRYCRNVKSKPLWPMSSGQPSHADIPNCSGCGGPRCLEFQVLPQLLYYFGVKNDADSLDWATIVVYACEASCDGATAYMEEFTWIQLSSQFTALP
ncbi:hypothetical protein MLD38_027642 [Melastoma candidum]|uniref:Uncharacterized protein n=1 Tax=Melastoma candidum TaxID=119954 RepID=A0ACB9P2W1_9MYRT|nr:hypothetical protein MLD38_027642 [Melastoma candidum]